MKLLVLFYSSYGHVHRLAQAIAEGASQVEGTEVSMLRVPETLNDDALKAMGALDARKAWADVPIAKPADLADFDAILFGTPTRFGAMAGQMRQFLDGTGSLWAAGKLVGKAAGVFTSSGTQHGGQESTILSFHTTLLHHGMVIVGLPYTFKGQSRVDEITGCSPYGASTVAGPQGERQPTENELEGARCQGRHTAEVARKLSA